MDKEEQEADEIVDRLKNAGRDLEDVLSDILAKEILKEIDLEVVRKIVDYSSGDSVDISTSRLYNKKIGDI